MIEEKEIVLDNITFIISKVPATDGRHIFTQYVPTATPKIGSYEENEKLMYRLISFTAIKLESGVTHSLKTKALIDNHVRSWETLIKLEAAMAEYNCSFFEDGRIFNFFENFARKCLQSITKTLTGSLERLSQMVKQRSKN